MKRIWFKTPSFRQFSMYDDGMDGEGAESPKRSSPPSEHMAKRAADNTQPIHTAPYVQARIESQLACRRWKREAPQPRGRYSRVYARL